MRKILLVLGLIIILLINGCSKSSSIVDNGIKPNNPLPIEYATKGFHSALYENYLVVEDDKRLKIIDLNMKKEIKSIPIPGGMILGFDIWGDNVVWSDLGNEFKKGDNKSLTYIPEGNADIFVYNISTGETKQITKDTSAQINPRIWQNYIVWQDNRDDKNENNMAEWNIYLYDMNTGKEKRITAAKESHTYPSIRDYKVVWEDGRNFSGDLGIRDGENLPENNTDIYLYDIKTGEEMPIATGKYKESKPFVYENYVVWEDRNNESYDADIMLYDLLKKERTQITKDNFNQGKPKIYGDYIVWEDERRGGTANDVIVNGIEPNADIFMYNLKTKEEKLMTGNEVQIMPNISSKWITFTLSRQVEPQIQVIKYSKAQTKDSTETANGRQ